MQETGFFFRMLPFFTFIVKKNQKDLHNSEKSSNFAPDFWEDMDYETIQKQTTASYDEANIIHLDDREHIRRRPGMYIGKLGDGSHSDDGIYVLIKETIDNSIDELRMGEGKVIEVQVEIGVEHGSVRVRDYGRGIPLGKMVDAVSMLNTGGKYDTKAFKKSVGLNGVGTKAVNMLSRRFAVQAFREGKTRRVEFEQGNLISDSGIIDNTENAPRGTLIEFEPDALSVLPGPDT